MGFLIDSSIIIAAERGKVDLESLLGRYPDEAAGLAAITASELLHGMYRAQPAERRANRQRFVEALLAHFPVTPFGLDIARVPRPHRR